MFAKPRSRSVPKILKPLIAYDCNGNPIRHPSPTRNGTGRGDTSSSSISVSSPKFNQNIRRRPNDSLPSNARLPGLNLRTTPKTAIQIIAKPAEVTVLTESTPHLTGLKFPFPRAEAYNKQQDRTAELVKYLNVLDKHRRTRSQIGRSAFTAGSKKKDAFAEPQFQFTTDLFNANSSEALIQVTRLLFDVLDEDEFRVRFRDCWPIHEKKQESMYRRAAFNWVQKIYADYPQFFHNPPQLAVFVTSCGERFMRFIKSFIECVMYIVAKRMTDEDSTKTSTLLEKPVLSGDPETNRKQVHALQTASACLSQNFVRVRERIIQHCTNQNLRQRNIENQLEHEQLKRAEQMSLVSKFIQDYPDWFPTNAVELVGSMRLEVIREAAKNKSIDLNSSGSLLSEYEDPLAMKLNDIWKERLIALERKHQHILNFCEKQKKFVSFVKALETNFNLVLDGKQIPGIFEENLLREDSSGLPDLSKYINIVLGRIDEFKADYPTGTVNVLQEPNFNRKVADQVKRTEALAKQVRELIRNSKVEEDKINDMKFQIKTQTMKLDEVDWNALMPTMGMGSKTLGLGDALSITPPVKKYDFTHETGLTPAMMSLLPSPVMTPTPAGPDRNIALDSQPSKSMEQTVRRANFRKTMGSRFQSHTAGASAINETISTRSRPNPNITESPISSRKAQYQGRALALHVSDKPLHTSNKSFHPPTQPPKVEPSDNDEQKHKLEDFVCKPTQVDIGSIYSPITISVSDPAARRKSQEHLARLKTALRFSESPQKNAAKEPNSPLNRDGSLMEEEEATTLSRSRFLELDEDALGILDVSICNISLMSSDEED